MASGELLVDLVILLAQRPRVAELVDHIELVGRLEQVLVIVLAMHIDEVLGHLLEHAERDRVAVEADRASAAGVEPAGEQQFAAVGGDWTSVICSISLQQRRCCGLSKTPLTRPSSDAGAEHLGGAAQAEQDFDRADDQALAGAGCAGEAVQARRRARSARRR